MVNFVLENVIQRCVSPKFTKLSEDHVIGSSTILKLINLVGDNVMYLTVLTNLVFHVFARLKTFIFFN